MLSLTGMVTQVKSGEIKVNESTRPNVALSAVLGVNGTSVTIDYTIENRSDSTIYVFDRLASFGDHGVVEVEAGQAFVLLDGGNAVRVICALMPNPKLKSIAKRPPNLASIVAPKDSRRGQLRLAFPLVERHPFFADVEPGSAPTVVVQRVRLQIGWVEQRGGMTISEVPTKSGPETQVAGGWGKPVQWQSEQILAAPGMQVVPHADPFERPPILQ